MSLERKLKAALEKIQESGSTEEAKEKVLEFLNDMRLRGTGINRIIVLATSLRRWAESLGGSFINPTKADVKQSVANLMDEKTVKHDIRNGKVQTDKPLAVSTIRGRKAALKQFYKWHLGNGEEYPDCVRWVKLEKIDPSDTVPEDHLTPEEVQQIIRAAHSMRDKCLIDVLYDTGARIGEMLALRIKHVVLDDLGYHLMIPDVQGLTKTGRRRIRLFESIPRLRSWLANHPEDDNREAYLFPAKKLPAPTETGQKRGKWTGEYGQLHYVSAWQAIKKAAKKAGIERRVYPHLFRHSRSTELAARDMGQAALEDRQGWVHGSKMAQTYINLSGVQQDTAFRKAMGLPTKEDDPEQKPKVCWACETENDPTRDECYTCGAGLSHKIMMQQSDRAIAAEQSLILEALTGKGRSSMTKELRIRMKAGVKELLKEIEDEEKD